MLEAANAEPRFTISLKRSTQKSSAIHKLGRPITPSFPLIATDLRTSRDVSKVPFASLRTAEKQRAFSPSDHRRAGCEAAKEAARIRLVCVCVCKN
jgi:hypothetical protein